MSWIKDMKIAKQVSVVLVLILLAFNAYAYNVTKKLSKLLGYTIVAADMVEEVYEKDYGEKYLKLYDGSIYKVEFLYLNPLVMTDVIVFAKPLPEEFVSKYQGKLPDYLLYSYKLLIDKEIYDATPE